MHRIALCGPKRVEKHVLHCSPSSSRHFDHFLCVCGSLFLSACVACDEDERKPGLENVFKRFGGFREAGRCSQVFVDRGCSLQNPPMFAKFRCVEVLSQLRFLKRRFLAQLKPTRPTNTSPGAQFPCANEFKHSVLGWGAPDPFAYAGLPGHRSSHVVW